MLNATPAFTHDRGRIHNPAPEAKGGLRRCAPLGKSELQPHPFGMQDCTAARASQPGLLEVIDGGTLDLRAVKVVSFRVHDRYFTNESEECQDPTTTDLVAYAGALISCCGHANLTCSQADSKGALKPLNTAQVFA